MARYSHPPLTTVGISRDTLGQLAFDVLIKMLRSKRRTGSAQVLQTQLVVRWSTGPAAHRKTERDAVSSSVANA